MSPMRHAVVHRFGTVLVACAIASSRVMAAPLFEQADVFVSGQRGYAGYRIPAIETMPNGALLALAEARRYGLNDPGFAKQEIDLVMKRSTDAGRTWSEMKVIEHAGELWSSGNPCTNTEPE